MSHPSTSPVTSNRRPRPAPPPGISEPYVSLFERVFVYAEPVPLQPAEPVSRHVWVRASGDHGSPVAGVVVAWQHAPVHNVNAASWLALVVTATFEDLLAISWVGAERLIELADPSPADGP